MRSIIKMAIVSGVVLAGVLGAGTASADETARVRGTGDDYTYEFLDDPLAARGVVPGGGTITVPKRQVRTLLIRPRTQFITEMLKSVENL